MLDGSEIIIIRYRFFGWLLLYSYNDRDPRRGTFVSSHCLEFNRYADVNPNVAVGILYFICAIYVLRTLQIIIPRHS